MPVGIMKKVPEKKKGSNRNLSKMPAKYPEIGKRFVFVKEQLKLTWDEMAEKLNTSRTTILLIKQGKTTPNYSILRGMKKHFGVSYDYLIDGELLLAQAGSDRIKELEMKVERLTKKLK